MLRRMKVIRIGLLQVDSIFDIMCQLQHRLLPADHDGRQDTLQLHPDVTKLAAFAGGSPRLLEVQSCCCGIQSGSQRC